jgi:hypothetical protein
MTTTSATKISAVAFDMRHMVRLYVDALAAGFVSPEPPVVNDQDSSASATAMLLGFRLRSAEVVGFKGERHKPSYRSVPPLDARRFPTFN